MSNTNQVEYHPTVPKKILYIRLQFRGDVASESLTLRLRKAIKDTFNAATIRVSFTTDCIVKPRIKDKLSHLTSSMCVYKFDCSCGASYVGRTMRQLSRRICEHCPVWWMKGENKNVNSSILAHLIDSNHVIDTNSAFEVVYKIPSRLPHGIRIRLLHIAEAIGIRLMKPELCVQKSFVLSFPSLGPNLSLTTHKHKKTPTHLLYYFI